MVDPRKTAARYRSVAAAKGWLEGTLHAPDDMDRCLGARLAEDAERGVRRSAPRDLGTASLTAAPPGRRIGYVNG